MSTHETGIGLELTNQRVTLPWRWWFGNALDTRSLQSNAFRCRSSTRHRLAIAFVHENTLTTVRWVQCVRVSDDDDGGGDV
jgi:hypothetical protein